MKQIVRDSCRWLLPLFFLLFSSQVFAAKAKGSKDLWISTEKNGSLVTTDSNGYGTLELGSEVDFSGYKYVQVECYSPDIKKFTWVLIEFHFTPEDDSEYDWDKSASLRIYNMSKKPVSYQGLVYEGSKLYDHWEDGDLIPRSPESVKVDRLCVGTFSEGWTGVAGAKVFVKKITATNTPLGKVHSVDFSKERFLAINQKDTWDDGSVHYCKYQELDGAKAGDVVLVKIEGKNAFALDMFWVKVFDSSDGGWKEVSSASLIQGLKKDQSIDETFYIPINTAAKKLTLEIVTFEGKTSGPYIIYSE